MIWLNGRLVRPAEGRIDSADRGFLLGDGLFETLAAYDGRLFRPGDHFARLRSGLEILGLSIEPSDEELSQAMLAILEANRLLAGPAALRLTITRGPSPRGLDIPASAQPTVLIASFSVASNPSPPARVVLVSQRRNEHSILCRIKSLNYLESVLARREAAMRGGEEAILLNTGGRIAGAGAANLFLIDGAGFLATPMLSEGPLPGITRALVLDLARNLGLAVEERKIERAELASTREAFLTNSLIGLRPIAAIDGRPLEAEGTITRRLVNSYAALTARPGQAPG